MQHQSLYPSSVRRTGLRFARSHSKTTCTKILLVQEHTVVLSKQYRSGQLPYRQVPGYHQCFNAANLNKESQIWNIHFHSTKRTQRYRANSVLGKTPPPIDPQVKTRLLNSDWDGCKLLGTYSRIPGLPRIYLSAAQNQLHSSWLIFRSTQLRLPATLISAHMNSYETRSTLIDWRAMRSRWASPSLGSMIFSKKLPAKK